MAAIKVTAILAALFSPANGNANPRNSFKRF